MKFALLEDKKPFEQTYLLSEADRWVFLQEAIDLFTHKRQGHLIHRCYLTQDALRYGGLFSSRKESYMKAGEICVIKNSGGLISDLASHSDGVIGIENGPGMRSAMIDKSIPFFSQIEGLHTWVGRDISPVSIDIMNDVMRDALPNVRIISDMSDFQTSAYPTTMGLGRKALVEFGMTTGNMEGFPQDGFPYHVIKADLQAHRARLSEGDIYAFTFDCNQNGNEVERAYNSEYTTLWGRELLRSMQSELPIMGDFDPDSYVFKSEWVASSHGGFNYMIATRRMKFQIANVVVTIEKGEGWGITNSFKLPIDMLQPLADETGYKLTIHHSKDKRIAFPAFIAC